MSVILTDMDMPRNCIQCPKRKVLHFPADDTGYYKDQYQLCPMNEDGYLTESWFNTKKLEDEPDFKSEHCPLKSIDGLLDNIYNMVDDSITFSHLVDLVSGRKDIEETVTAIGDDYRKIVMDVIKKYCEAGDTDG